MAKAPVVTRTMKVTIADILVLDLDTEKTDKISVELPRTYKNSDEIIKAAEKHHDYGNVKLVHVINSTIKEKRYAMTEEIYLKYAKEIAPLKKTESETDEI